MGAVGRLRRALRRYGVTGTIRRSGELATELVKVDQAHVWYELPLRGERPKRELPPDFDLLRAGEEHLPMLHHLWAIDDDEARRRLRTHGTLWLVVNGGRPAFSCWTFRERTPIRAAQGGWLELPSDAVCLEESLTAPDYRGRGVAPGAWCEIADRLADEPAERLVTAVEEDNIPSRKAVEKIGFREIGVARTTKRGRRLSVSVTHSADSAAFLDGLAR